MCSAQLAALPSKEDSRITAVCAYQNPEIPTEQCFDDTTRLAARLFRVPFAFISLRDGQRLWIKSHVGLNIQEFSCEGNAFCEQTYQQGDLLEVTDTGQDARFANHPYVVSKPHIRFYAGIPLLTPEGEAMGTLCIMDRSPRRLLPEDKEALWALSRQVITQLQLRHSLTQNSALFHNLQRSNQELKSAYDNTIEGWARALDLRDKETEGHSRRVTEMTVLLAMRLGVPEEERMHMRRGALLHDIGKMGVPDSILLKPQALTQDEWEIMRCHPTYAYKMLEPIAFLGPALGIPYCHHEHWDGNGYPHGLSGDDIPLGARIFAIADVWDALRSDRPYRPAWPVDKVIEHIRSLRGTQFDPRIVDAFLSLLEELPPDSGLL